MILLGNDVVDLSDPDSDLSTVHSGFLSRSFGAAELAEIQRAGGPDPVDVWTRWAAREAALKAFRQWDPDFVCSWPEFETELRSNNRLFVSHPRGRFSGNWQLIPGGGVHVVCLGGAPQQFAPEEAGSVAPYEDRHDRIRLFLAEVDALAMRAADAPDESALIRHWVKEQLILALQLSRPAVIMDTPEGVPYLAVNGLRRGTLSLSHHGRFLAAAYLDER